MVRILMYRNWILSYVNILISLFSIDKYGCNTVIWRDLYTNIFKMVILLFFLCTGKKSNCEVPTLRNGRVRVRSKGRVVRFRCRKRFKLYGSKISLCLSDGWNFPPPICVGMYHLVLIEILMTVMDFAINIVYQCIVSFLPAPGRKCPKLKPSKELTISKELNSGVWKLSCQPGLQLQGRDFIYCDGSKWSGELPSCVCKCHIRPNILFALY